MQRNRVACLIAVVLMAMAATPATAQLMKVGSDDFGKVTFLSETPAIVDGLMMRANGIETDTLGWALTVQGTDASIDVQMTADGEAVELLRLSTSTEAPGGRTTVFLREQAFRRIANAGEAALTVGDKTVTLPEKLQNDMRLVLKRLLG